MLSAGPGNNASVNQSESQLIRQVLVDAAFVRTGIDKCPCPNRFVHGKVSASATGLPFVLTACCRYYTRQFVPASSTVCHAVCRGQHERLTRSRCRRVCRPGTFNRPETSRGRPYRQPQRVRPGRPVDVVSRAWPRARHFPRQRRPTGTPTRWRRRTDNDGTVRVLVPHGQDTPADRHPVDVQPRMRDHFWRERKKRGLSVSPWQLRLEATAFVVACHRRRVEAQANRGRLN